jgi:hypothetical protein
MWGMRYVHIKRVTSKKAKRLQCWSFDPVGSIATTPDSEGLEGRKENIVDRRASILVVRVEVDTKMFKIAEEVVIWEMIEVGFFSKSKTKVLNEMVLTK